MADSDLPPTWQVGAHYPRSIRLRKRPEFLRVQGSGRRRSGRHLVVVALANDQGRPRFGLVVSRKVGNAVIRNRVKRRLKEVLRHHKSGWTGVDVVIIARSSAAKATASDLGEELLGLLKPLRGSAR